MKRLMTALASIALIGTLFVGAPKPVFATGGADTYYVGFGGGSDAGCGVPDYDLDYTDAEFMNEEYYWDGDSYEVALKLEDALYEFFDNDDYLDVTDGDTIVICDGWFHLHSNGPEWNGDLTPGVDVDPSTITIRGLGINNTVIEGTDGDGVYYRPFYFTNTNLILESMTIINTSSLWDNNNLNGGAIHLNYGSLEISDVDFVNFVADGDDGAGSGGAINVIDADVDFNNASFDRSTGVYPYDSDFNEGDGGALYAYTSSNSVPNLVVTIDDSDFNNIGTQNSGGAIFVECASTTITDTDFTDNTAGIHGGAIWAWGSSDCNSTGQLTIDSSTFEGNYLHNGFGGDFGNGGAVASTYQPVTITDSVFGTTSNGNSAGVNGDGGALWVDGTSGTIVTVEDSDFGDNYADDNGGAIYTHCVNLEVSGDATGTPDDIGGVPSSVFYSNLADDIDGGAIFIGAEGCNNDDGLPAPADFVTALIDGVYMHENDADSQGGAIATDQDNFNYLTELEVRFSTFFSNGSLDFNNQGGALNSDYVDISIYSSTFIDNHTNGLGGAVELCGGNLHVEDSYFDGNEAEDNGGVFLVNDGCGRSDAGNVTIIDSDFYDNTSYDDGGVLASESGRPTVTISGSSFTDNTSGNEGGALDIYDATTAISTSVFEGNLAGGEGGAINTENTNSLTVRNSEFTDNSSGYNWFGIENNEDGGAIDFEGDGIDPYLGVFDSQFDGNYATADGGAIWSDVDSGPGLIQIVRTTFMNNTVDSEGGAMYVDLDNEGTFTVDRSTFSDNLAWEDGGAINQDTDSSGTFVRITNSRFLGNFADSDGGAMDLTDYTVLTANTFTGNSLGYENGYGGAVELNSNNADSSLEYLFSVTNNTFSDNYADWDGGALSVNDKSIITGNRFTNNYSDEDGGAIDIDNDYTALDGQSVISRNIFAGNRSEDDGGAIHADYESIISSNTFTGNVAEDDGGAIYADDDYTIITKNTFVGNSALDNGGALYADDLGFGDSYVTDNLFEGNAATDNGGAMWLDDDDGAEDHKVVIASNRIVRNIAKDGAGIYVTFPSGAVSITQLMTGIARNTFERNVASLNGGAMMMEYRGGTYSNARAALQALKKAAKNNRYKANKANLDRATGDIGGVAITGIMSEVAEAEPLRTLEVAQAK